MRRFGTQVPPALSRCPPEGILSLGRTCLDVEGECMRRDPKLLRSQGSRKTCVAGREGSFHCPSPETCGGLTIWHFCLSLVKQRSIASASGAVEALGREEVSGLWAQLVRVPTPHQPSSGPRSGLSQTSSSALEKREPTLGGFFFFFSEKTAFLWYCRLSLPMTYLRVTEQEFTNRLKGIGENNRKWKKTEVPGLRLPSALLVNCQTSSMPGGFTYRKSS